MTEPNTVPAQSSAGARASSQSFTITCPNCGGTRFRFSIFEARWFKSDTASVDECDEDGLDTHAGAICSACGYECDSDSMVWRALEEAWGRYTDGFRAEAYQAKG